MQDYIRRRSAENVGGCWYWLGQLDKDGYGQFRKRYPGKWTKAHRASYQAFIGEIPAGLGVLHRCNARNCVNPAHLYTGSQKDNVADMMRPIEEKIAKILPEIVPWQRGDKSIRAMARKIGVHHNRVARRLGEYHSLDRQNLQAET